MATSSANVKVGTTGKIYVGPVGTTLPTAHSTTPAAGFTELGYISDAGVTEAMATTTNKIRAWQNADVVREVQTEHDLTFKFACLETNATVLATFYGNYTTGDIEINGLQPVAQEWVLDVIDGVDVIRVVIPYGQITDRGDVQYVNADAVMYDMTVTAYPDPNYIGSQTAAAKAYKYILDASGGIT